MTLQDLNLKAAYDSDEDDILNDFYIPALSQAVRYRRLAGFFCSTTLAVCAQGIGDFIKRKGRMELVASAKLTKEDAEAIMKGTYERDRVLAESGVRDLSQITEEFVRDHVRALAYMVANSQLDIKIAIHLDRSGKPLDEDTIRKIGIFHPKVGLFIDDANDMISFSGSINETAYAWIYNIEEFKVFRSWKEGERPQFEADVKKINKYLLGKARNAIVIDVPTAIRDKLIEMAPKDISEIDLTKYQKQVFTQPKARRSLRGYQVTAIHNWKEAGFSGIFEMATGTGKTLVALRAVALHVPKNALTIVVVPFTILAGQWEEEIAKEFQDARIIRCDSSKPNWLEALTIIKDYVLRAEPNARPAFVVTTYNTGASEKFGEIIDSIPPDKLCLIADEVHHAGAPVFSNLLDHDFKYRIGLSATPERMWDEGGQQKIMDFFKRIVFEFTIRDALAPNNQVLSTYNYYIHTTSLKDDELEDYSRMSAAIFAKISQLVKSHPSLGRLSLPRLFSELSTIEPEEVSNLQMLLFRRNNILKKARGKSEILKQIIASGNLGRCLIYCNDIDHLNETLRLLQSSNINALKYDSTMASGEREANLSTFSTGVIQYLVAVKCLDEGVDIPTCDSAILIASSKSEREFIQRRGRLLRKGPNKTNANIHDIVVLPIDPESAARNLSRLEFEIINSEFERARVFAESANNSADILLEISRLEAELASRVVDSGVD